MKTLFLTITLIGSAILFAGCATATSPNAYHKYFMRGQVLDSTDKQIYVCVGNQDGAQVGQQLVVYDIMRHGKVGQYSRRAVGVVRIDQIVDEHFAKASILKGTAEVGNVVELKME